jgi:NAD+ kinase
MSSVALFVHSGKAEAVALGAEVSAWLEARGHGVVDPEGDAPIDLALAIGGDGTMLRATRRAVDDDAAILGVNLGQLGYLAEVEPHGWEAALDGFFAGRHAIAERLLVTTSILVGGGDAPAVGEHLPPGLNEVVIEKQDMGRTVTLGVSIDGEFFHTYVADGVIVATPTGSTAYSLSARGPIVAPTHRALILTAVAPHSLFDRSLVLEPSSVVEVEVLGDRPATASVDGLHDCVLSVGTRVAITAADRPARFVTFGGRDFHRILKAKFGLSDR